MSGAAPDPSIRILLVGGQPLFVEGAPDALAAEQAARRRGRVRLGGCGGARARRWPPTSSCSMRTQRRGDRGREPHHGPEVAAEGRRADRRADPGRHGASQRAGAVAFVRKPRRSTISSRRSSSWSRSWSTRPGRSRVLEHALGGGRLARPGDDRLRSELASAAPNVSNRSVLTTKAAAPAAKAAVIEPASPSVPSANRPQRGHAGARVSGSRRLRCPRHRRRATQARAARRARAPRASSRVRPTTVIPLADNVSAIASSHRRGVEDDRQFWIAIHRRNRRIPYLDSSIEILVTASQSVKGV
jgi:hypothetical protein